MNSRDAAYDDEQLRRAIEASKEDSTQDTELLLRRTKRGRSDSEECVYLPALPRAQQSNPEHRLFNHPSTQSLSDTY